MNKNIIALLAVGIILRLLGINQEPIWLDEAITLYFAQHSLLTIIGFSDPTPPLHMLLVHFWGQLFGFNLLAGRVLSAIFQIIAIPYLYLLSLKLTDKKTATYTTIIFVFASYMIFYAQELRAYSLFASLSIIATYYFLNLDFKNKISIFKFAISCLLLLYTHYFAILILVIFNSYLLISKKISKQWIILQLFIGLCFLPQIFNILYSVEAYNWLDFKLNEVIGLNTIFAGNIFLGILFLWLSIYGFYKTDKKLFFSLWIFIPIVITLIYSIIKNPAFLSRNLIIIAIPFYILTAQGISKLKYEKFVIIAIILLSLVSVFIQAATIEKERYDLIDYKGQIVLEPADIIYPISYYSVCFESKVLEECMKNNNFYFDVRNATNNSITLISRNNNQSDAYQILSEQKTIVNSAYYPSRWGDLYVTYFS